ncbi:aldo-keto reductase yakc [Aspergillus arachidicola]|uniref:Aldo-keto reductase yakc n=1 Tax=Aspergillus arachidicola TaxID=656916 RepID=A0A2G7FS86_9EURO|nr:aldo-keto reductase yakc [Aspergillus arachidicola]
MPCARRLLEQKTPVTPIGYGAMSLSAYYTNTPEPDSKRLAFLDQVYTTGQRFWDTANNYGDNEELIGKWLALNPDKRKNIVLATKFGQTSYIDLYYVHRVDTAVPIEKTVEGLVVLRRENSPYWSFGGVASDSSEGSRCAPHCRNSDGIQSFRVGREKPETDLLNTTKELGVALVAYSPLSRGLLSGRLKSLDDLEEGDFRRGIPRFFPENFHKNLELAEMLHTIAARNGITVGQLALAWLLAQGDNVIPIPGTKSIDYFNENMGALEVELSMEDLREIRAAAEKADVRGHRYAVETSPNSYFADTPPLE